MYLKEETKPNTQKRTEPSLPENSSPAGTSASEISDKKSVESNPKLIHEETVVQPELLKAMITVIRPTILQKEDSFSGRAADLMESMKDKTEEAIDSIKSATGQGVSRTIFNLGSEPLVIPIIEQKGTSETKTYTEEITIEKRQVKRKKNIEVKVSYDEIFVNGKEIGSGMGDAFREIKDRILEIVTFDKDREEKELEKIKRDMIPLLENNSETEKVIPLYVEQVVISKRTVKVGDLIIRKRKVTEKNKATVDLITEHLTIENPTGGASTSETDVR